MAENLSIFAVWCTLSAMQLHRRQNVRPSYEDSKNNPLLSDVVERNIRTILRLRDQAAHARSAQDRVADAITEFSGNLAFVYLHVAWFAAWLLINTGKLGIAQFDPYPYGLLTMIVSLEAIFLSTFVLISQNRLSKEADRRADLDLHIGLLGEAELTRVLRMLHAIQDKLGIESDDAEEQADLELKTRPEDVLEEMNRLQGR